MLSTRRRMTRLAAVLGTTAVVVSGLAVASDVRAGSASTPSASDICVIVPAVWVHNVQLYGGGLVCIPVPLASQRA